MSLKQTILRNNKREFSKQQITKAWHWYLVLHETTAQGSMHRNQLILLRSLRGCSTVQYAWESGTPSSKPDSMESATWCFMSYHHNLHHKMCLESTAKRVYLVGGRFEACLPALSIFTSLCKWQQHIFRSQARLQLAGGSVLLHWYWRDRDNSVSEKILHEAQSNEATKPRI